MSSWRSVLGPLTEVMDGWTGPWAFTAGAGLALQGMDRVPTDVDILADGTAGTGRGGEPVGPAEASGSLETELRGRLAPLFPRGLVSRDRGESVLCHRSLHGELGGVAVEIMLWPPARASALPSPWAHVRHVELDGRMLPVMDPAWEEGAYAAMDRPARARAVARFLARHTRPGNAGDRS